MHTSKVNPLCLLTLTKCYRNRTIAAHKTKSTFTNTIRNELKSWKKIPGPPSLPFLGPLHNILRVGAKVKLFDKYGPIIRFNGALGIEPTILIGDPEAAEHILRSENSLPIRPGFNSLEHYRRYYKQNEGENVECTGLLTEQGEVWKKCRSAVNPVLLQPKTVQLYRKVLDEIALEMVERLRANRDENNMISRQFDSELNLWSLKSIGTVALGYEINCLDPNLPKNSPEKELARCIQHLLVVTDPLDFKPNIWKYLRTPQYEKAMKAYARHDSLIRHFLDKGMERFKTNEKSDTKLDHKKGILEKFFEIDEQYAYIMANEMLFAGVDTVVISTIGILYLLATNQDKQQNLREEIVSKPKNMPYLKACIKEGLRIMPPVTGVFRRTTKEYNLLGYRIPKGMMITICHRNMSLMDEHYPRAKEFIPERWLVAKDDPLYHGNANPFTTSPFGYGNRSCVGRRIAELEMETLLTRIVENFNVEWVGPPPKLLRKSLIYIKGPFNFVFKDVNK